MLQDLPKLDPKPIKGGRLDTPDTFREQLKGKRFICTVAQNNTLLHENLWKTLTRMAEKRKARLLVGKETYNKNGWQKLTTESDGIWFDDRLVPHFIEDTVKLADSLIFCGELDILPTAQMPLNGLDNYTGSHSAIIPHVKMQMKALATMKYEEAKHLYTTGSVTLRNYIQRRVGQIAEYNHVYGALWVEVDNKGKWWVRQLNADENGIIYDVDTVWGPDWDAPAVNFGRPVINLGDIHEEKRDTQQTRGALNMLRNLNPSHVVVHDLIDFSSRNHHNIKDAHFIYNTRHRTVEQDVAMSADWLYKVSTMLPDTKLLVIKSNHDEALDKWVKSTGRELVDQNLRYWHYLNLWMLDNPDGDVFEHAVYLSRPDLQDRNIQFVRADESVLIHGIEFGMHGHYGPNGARGNPRAFRQIGRRANTGHTHSAGIIDGVWTAGVLGSLDMQYNRGPSSWSCSHIITYPNAKRTIITQRGPKWRA